MATEDRIIALIDMDCFFCQVEARDNPELKGKPLVVCQSNVVLAVSYEAREQGVKRFVRSEEAKEQCPDVNIVNSPIAYGKSDNSKYRSAGQEVINVLKQYCPTIERASIDESYLDITKLVEERMESINYSSNEIKGFLRNTFVVGYCDESNDEDKRAQGLDKWMEEVFDDMGDDQARKLGIAAMIVEEFRGEILKKCQFTCSAGISYNKVLAKLACGLHKPNKQTILTASEVADLFTSIPVDKVRNLGGKIGKILIDSLQCSFMSDLMKFTIQELQKQFDEKTATWLFNIARGVDNEPVTSRLICKSIAASKNFFGKAAIVDADNLREWLHMLAGDLVERLQQDLEDNQRRATTLVISYHYLVDKKSVSQSRTCAMTSYKKEKIADIAFDVITKAMQTPIVFISLATSKFVAVQKNQNFVNYFKNVEAQSQNKLEKVEDTGDEEELIENNVEETGGVSEILVRSNRSREAEDNETFMKLQEIFPDLNDIDKSVLELLPIQLQKEAKTYLKSVNELGNSDKVVTGESPKAKSTKSKIKSGKICKNRIDNFLVKNTLTNVKDESMIQCNECKNMIEGDKYLEHCDFHVAQNLQKNINKSVMKGIENSKRNREKSSSPKTHKKTRSIESYFGR